MRVIQVGIGEWGIDWACTIVPQVPTVRIVGYVNRQAEKAVSAASRLQVTPALFFRSIADAFTATGADAALILTTTDAHTELVTEALELGMHVLVEKPFAEKVTDAQKLTALAIQRDRVLMVNQNFRYFPAAMRAREIVRSGELGRLGEVRVDFRRNIVFASESRARWHQSMFQPLVMDLGIHHFDLMRMITGAEPVEVHAIGANPSWSKYRDLASASALIRFENGLVVNWSGSWISRAPQTTYSGDWRMEFESGCVDWSCRGDRDVTLEGEKLSIRRNELLIQETLPTPRLFGRAAVLADFNKAFENRRLEEFFPSASDNVKSLELAHKVLEAIHGKA
ncbi:MAG: Gfo/Idh/MocA family oxidoreductase [Mesorhizobium sp.]|uniref:Gfo/Idh/MocA family protein n=1 Tax=Mesorhizobium sp. TaxID=1871066 RepID=UPI0012172EDA|nr:Gfo/Idh/MocA family oxidoreductase [Mesorhizobium sp.]TIR47400.1 MAG: Gfo/Idh/MocA family oxidoreductase [Mesorhizobium sp.]